MATDEPTTHVATTLPGMRKNFSKLQSYNVVMSIRREIRNVGCMPTPSGKPEVMPSKNEVNIKFSLTMKTHSDHHNFPRHVGPAVSNISCHSAGLEAYVGGRPTICLIWPVHWNAPAQIAKDAKKTILYGHAVPRKANMIMWSKM